MISMTYIIYRHLGFLASGFPVKHCVNVCEFLWFQCVHAIDLISAYDDQWWNRLCIVHEVK